MNEAVYFVSNQSLFFKTLNVSTEYLFFISLELICFLGGRRSASAGARTSAGAGAGAGAGTGAGAGAGAPRVAPGCFSDRCFRHYINPVLDALAIFL